MEEEIKIIIEKNKSNISEQELLNQLSKYSKLDVENALNDLVSNKKIEKFLSRGIYKYRIIKLSQEDSQSLIHNLIIQSDVQGMSLNELKSKTNLPQAMVNKCIKNLEHALLIKTVKSHKNNQKLLISYDKTPSEEITGGKWFSAGDIDEQFVNEVLKVIDLYITNKSRNSLVRISLLPTIRDIHEFISNSKITSIILDESDIKLLLNIMVAEGSIQEIEKDGKYFYKKFKI
ncbi:hypothetical protein H312_03231 [Anncaliia algerae PRA339]|uniref:DNA-directed RNA polymerase III subunit RPC6 n=1 Tax=Anncaliia algerae PRA339 TaxID=1288291 RepID=A0A059EWY0_9MICR|nr:hypothetical protein H312_03231 [Anncaliia algerae PRA339]